MNSDSLTNSSFMFISGRTLKKRELLKAKIPNKVQIVAIMAFFISHFLEKESYAAFPANMQNKIFKIGR